VARRTPGFSLESQPEVFFSNTADSRTIRGLLKAGRVRHVAARIYTKNLDDPLEQVVRRRVWDVAAGMFPGAVIADRTAFEMKPAGSEGSVFLCSHTTRVVRLPGLVLNCRRGPGPVRGDQTFLGEGLYLSSWPRRFLDNMRASRARTGPRRTLSQAEIEEQLQTVLANRGEGELNRLRDEASQIAQELDRVKEFERLRSLIGALLGTGDARLATARARATQKGEGWDDRRLPLFDELLAGLHVHVSVERPERPGQTGATFAFYEAYFSNFIEGTEFTVEEAQQIVFERAIPVDRPKDAHDVLGTFDLVSDPTLRARTPASAKDLEAVILAFHRRIMAGRPEMHPGRYKTKTNRAGSTEFVRPTLVRGTLQRGYERYASLGPGLPRAAFATFLIAEVHPFADGNGRVARALANAELSAAGQQRLMIPIVFREDYLQALRAMSHRGDPKPFIRVLDRAQRWAHEVDWSDPAAAKRELERTNALLTTSEAEERGVILRLPSELAPS
jgi:Fic/DOC family